MLWSVMCKSWDIVVVGHFDWKPTAETSTQCRNTKLLLQMCNNFAKFSWNQLKCIRKIYTVKLISRNTFCGSKFSIFHTVIWRNGIVACINDHCRPTSHQEQKKPKSQSSRAIPNFLSSKRKLFLLFFFYKLHLSRKKKEI